MPDALARRPGWRQALRCLKRRISDAIYSALAADARHAAPASPKDPGGQTGNHSVSRAADSHPERRHFGKATPGPATTIRPGAPHRRAANPAAVSKKSRAAT